MALIVMGLEGYIFGRFEREILSNPYSHSNKTSSRAIPTYFALFLFAEIFGLIIAWDSLRQKNTIQVIGLCFYHLALMVYAIIQIDQIRDSLFALSLLNDDIWGTSKIGSLQPWLLVIPCLIGLCTVILTYFAYRLYEEFGWTIFKHIGADLAMRRRFMAYQIFLTLLKFDFIFFVGFTIQFTVIILDVQDPEFGLTVAVIPITILGLVFTTWALRNEKMWGMYITLGYFVCAMAYFLFKLIRIYSGPLKAQYGSAKRPLVTFAILTLALLIASMANAAVCMRNFHQGLKGHVKRKAPVNGSPELHFSEWGVMPDAKIPLQTRLALD